MASRVLTVKLLGEAKGALGAMDQTGKGAGRMGKAVVAGAAVAGAALVGAGALALKFGQDFDDAFNTIRTGTGATGDELDGLEDSFKSVLAGVPQNMSIVAQATADLNTELGLTDEELEGATKAALDASRVFKEDIGGIIPGVSDSLAIFNREGSEFEATLDKMAAVSQKTGVPIASLSATVETYGPVLKNAGFEMEEAIALFGSLEGSGISVSRVMPGINASMRKMADEGVTDLKQGLLDQIDAIRGTEDASEALNLATETFGAEGAQRMLTAIRNGTLDLGDMMKAMDEAGGTVDELGKETLTLKDRFAILKNRGLVAAEPALTAFFEGVERLVDFFVERMIPAFQQHVQPTLEAFSGFLVSDVIPVIRDQIMPALKTFTEDVLGALVTTFQNDVQPKLETFAAIMRDPVLPAVAALAGAIEDHLFPVVKKVIDFLANNKEFLVGVGVAIAAILVPAFVGWALAAGAAAVATVIATAPIILIGLAIAALVGGIIWAIRHWDKITEAIGRFVDGAKEFLGDAVDWLKEKFFGFLDSKFIWLAGLLGPLGLILIVWQFRDNIMGAFSAAADWVGDRVNDIVGFFEALPGRMGALVSNILDAALNIGRGIKDGIVSGIKEIGGSIQEIAESIRGALKSALNISLQWLHDNVAISIPAFDPPGPGSIPGFDWNFPLVQFDKGGIVPGPVGAPMPILAHGGETVLPTHKRGGGFGGQSVTVVLQSLDPRDGADYLARLLDDLRRQGRITVGA